MFTAFLCVSCEEAAGLTDVSGYGSETSCTETPENMSGCSHRCLGSSWWDDERETCSLSFSCRVNAESRFRSGPSPHPRRPRPPVDLVPPAGWTLGDGAVLLPRPAKMEETITIV